MNPWRYCGLFASWTSRLTLQRSTAADTEFSNRFDKAYVRITDDSQRSRSRSPRDRSPRGRSRSRDARSMSRSRR